MTEDQIAALQPFDVECVHDFNLFLQECRTHSVSDDMYALILSSINQVMQEITSNPKFDGMYPDFSKASWLKDGKAKWGLMLKLCGPDHAPFAAFAFGMSDDLKVIEKFQRLKLEELALLTRPAPGMMN